MSRVASSARSVGVASDVRCRSLNKFVLELPAVFIFIPLLEILAGLQDESPPRSGDSFRMGEQLPPRGVEHAAKVKGKPHEGAAGGAKSGARPASAQRNDNRAGPKRGKN